MLSPLLPACGGASDHEPGNGGGAEEGPPWRGFASPGTQAGTSGESTHLAPALPPRGPGLCSEPLFPHSQGGEKTPLRERVDSPFFLQGPRTICEIRIKINTNGIHPAPALIRRTGPSGGLSFPPRERKREKGGEQGNWAQRKAGSRSHCLGRMAAGGQKERKGWESQLGLPY